jgi:trimethylamine--corrinoid protein Co-methyltransferase
MTGAGVLALGAAETIGAMALGYAIDENAILGMDISPTYADMSSGIFRYAGSERGQLLMARVQLLSEYYGCPCGVHGGKTDSCFLNEQAGAEKMASMLLPVMAGAVAIGTVGHLENAVTFSPVQLAIDAEIARFVRRAVVKPFEVNEETLAVDLVQEVGIGGNFLGEMHTAEHFRDELLLSPLFPAKAWDTARSAPENFETVAKATALARELWYEPEAMVLSDDQVRAIDAILARAGA